jgi:diacylglycerol kinase family enzyme
MLGVGFDAHVVRNLPFPLKKAFGKGAYVMQSMRELTRYRFPPIRMRIDDTETEAASVIISKGRLYGGRFRLAADAEPSQPGFSVVLFDLSGPWAAMLYGSALPLNLLGQAPGVRHIRARRIDFLHNQAVPAQTDGDAAGYAPLWVGDAPGPIQVVVG